MPHRRTLREAFDPEQIAVIAQAFEKARAFALRAGYGDEDPDVQDNLAAQIVEAGKEVPELLPLDVANRAIARYRIQRERLLAMRQNIQQTALRQSRIRPHAMDTKFGGWEQTAAPGISGLPKALEPQVRT
jgi:hypothetical protein